ncbi:hypothetical protein [Paenibacillus sp. Soil522]|nr:hypothetical protein [Paenibacillus sp. Soil522]
MTEFMYDLSGGAEDNVVMMIGTGFASAPHPKVEIRLQLKKMPKK